MSSKDTDFPELGKGFWAKTSEPDPKYNCVAFAAGRTDVFWWPDAYPDPDSDYWPHGILREETVAAFIQLFQSLNFEECADGLLEANFEKIALFSIGTSPTHVARQTAMGQWVSKLGVEEDIVHDSPESVAGPCYGAVAQYMRRPRNP